MYRALSGRICKYLFISAFIWSSAFSQSSAAQSITVGELLKSISHNEEWVWVKATRSDPNVNGQSTELMRQDGWEISLGRTKITLAGKNIARAKLQFSEGEFLLKSIVDITVKGGVASAVETRENTDSSDSMYVGTISKIKSDDRRAHYVITLQNETSIIRLHNF
jgi:hypothetical protein